MLRNYAVLNSSLLQPDSGLCQPSQSLPQRVGFDDAAESVMTDLKQVSAVLIRPGDGVEEANQRMIQHGVRLLFASPDLRIVENGYRVSGIDAVTFTHANFKNAAGCLGSNCGVVAFDPATHGNDAVRDSGCSKKDSPNKNRRANQDHARYDHHDSAASRGDRFRIAGYIWLRTIGV